MSTSSRRDSTDSLAAPVTVGMFDNPMYDASISSNPVLTSAELGTTTANRLSFANPAYEEVTTARDLPTASGAWDANPAYEEGTKAQDLLGSSVDWDANPAYEEGTTNHNLPAMYMEIDDMAEDVAVDSDARA